MRLRMKYVVIDDPSGTRLYLFTEDIEHSAFAHCHLHGDAKVLSAGFATADPQNGPRCYGKSVSLGVASRSERDTDMLRRHLGWVE